MDLQTLLSPIVLRIDDPNFKNKFKESEEKNTDTFYLDYKDICNGQPLSIFLVFNLFNEKYGKLHGSFEYAREYFYGLCGNNRNKDGIDFNGRVGIVSLGKKINYSIVNNEALSVSI